MNRRDFLTTIGAAAAAVGSGTSSLNAVDSTAARTSSSPSKKQQTIGIQIGSISFLDEGTENVLDLLQEQGRINTLFIATFTYGQGIAGRQLRGHPFPDHGSINTPSSRTSKPRTTGMSTFSNWCSRLRKNAV